MFGFGQGKIEITLEKHNFKPGETIKGTISLKLKKPVQARQLKVVFAGLMTQTKTGFGLGQSGASYSSKQRSQYVHRFEMKLDGEKEYAGESSYPFEIAIPADIMQKSPEGALGTAIKAVQLLGGVSSRVKWFVESSLDMPGLDINKKVQINLT